MDTKTLCLGVLTLGDASGYDVRKQLTETFSNFMEISPSGIYPALRDLEERALVTSARVVQDDRPNKKVYSITDAGRAVFVDGLASSPGRHRVRSEMLALMFFAEHVPTDHLIKVLTERAGQLDAWTTQTNDWLGAEAQVHSTPGQRFITHYALAVMKAETDFLGEELPRLRETLRHTEPDPASPELTNPKPKRKESVE